MPSKKVTKSQPSANDIHKAKANNLPSIHVIELDLKKSEFYRDQSLVAEYLQNCSNTDTLQEIIDAVESFFEKFSALHANS